MVLVRVNFEAKEFAILEGKALLYTGNFISAGMDSRFTGRYMIETVGVLGTSILHIPFSDNVILEEINKTEQ